MACAPCTTDMNRAERQAQMNSVKILQSLVTPTDTEPIPMTRRSLKGNGSGQACALYRSTTHVGDTKEQLSVFSVGSRTTHWRPVAVLSVEVANALGQCYWFLCDPQLPLGQTAAGCSTVHHRTTIWSCSYSWIRFLQCIFVHSV